MAGVDLVTLAALLGHSKLAMVTRYAHPTEAHQFEALKKLQAFMARRTADYSGPDPRQKTSRSSYSKDAYSPQPQPQK